MSKRYAGEQNIDVDISNIDSCIKVGSSADFRYAEDEERWEVGNYFQTEEEAEEVAKISRGALGKFHKENE